MHRHAHDLRNFLARLRADRLDGGAALAEHDLALAFALDKDRLLDADRFILALGPAVGLNGRLIRQFLMQLAEDFFPGDFSRQMPHRRIRHLILRIMERPRRHHLRQRVAQVADAIARQRRDHESAGEGQPLIGGLGKRQQFFARDQVDLVQHQDFLVINGCQPGEDRVGFLVNAFARIEQHADQIGIVRPTPCRRHHRAVEPPLRREDSGGVDQNDLRVVFDHDAADQGAGGLHLARDDRDLGADQRVDQRGLADIGGADQRDEATTGRGRHRVILRVMRHF